MAGPAAEVLANLRSKLEGFQEHLPLIKALRNPGLRDRHWDKISQSKLLATVESTHDLLLHGNKHHCAEGADTEVCTYFLMACPLQSLGMIAPHFHVGVKHAMHMGD